MNFEDFVRMARYLLDYVFDYYLDISEVFILII